MRQQVRKVVDINVLSTITTTGDNDEIASWLPLSLPESDLTEDFFHLASRSSSCLCPKRYHTSDIVINTELESTGYSALPSPPRIMWRTHTQRDTRRHHYLLRCLSGGEGNDIYIIGL